ncbi:MAG: diadenylate cyclase CdaA [Cyanobacteria bacterium]|nr:diadenylate cyclase CdaA [Cyanobacteriota bacterium]MDA1020621.1 diadenylate cyclase CdaA [Cyanobacteriota bacterium]
MASLIIQLAFITWLIYQVYMRFQGTQAERVLRGLVLIIPVILLCYALKLQIITRLLEIFSPTILIGLIVIFAPEFRRVLMQLGGNLSLVDYLHIAESKKSINDACDEIIQSLANLQKNKIGALIAIEKANVDRYYINPGKSLNATLSQELLLTILNPKSPLHDGAVILKGFTVIAAGVILPMTENPKLDWQYGTRHRAAIGFSEITDSLILVVSEETGEISSAQEGRLTSYANPELLRNRIQTFYSELLKTEKKSSKVGQYINDFFASIKAIKQGKDEDKSEISEEIE